MRWAAVSLGYSSPFTLIAQRICTKKKDGYKMVDLPVRFKERMKELLGEGYEAFEASYDKERVQGLRLNSLKTADGNKGRLGGGRCPCTGQAGGRAGRTLP